MRIAFGWLLPQFAPFYPKSPHKIPHSIFYVFKH
jgi:hypothetical protein